MVVTFCGHADFSPNESIRQWFSETVAGLIQNGADKFYLGGYGGFDRFAAVSLWDMKTEYPDITSVLVLPYLDRKVNADHYDYTTYPPLEEAPRRFAISKRNEWMVDESDAVVAYVTHDWGGAAATLGYARRRKKTIFNYADTEPYQSQFDVRSLQILEIGLSSIAANRLLLTGAWTVNDVLLLTPEKLWQTKGVGTKIYTEIVDRLEALGIDVRVYRAYQEESRYSH